MSLIGALAATFGGCGRVNLDAGAGAGGAAGTGQGAASRGGAGMADAGLAHIGVGGSSENHPGTAGSGAPRDDGGGGGQAGAGQTDAGEECPARADVGPGSLAQDDAGTARLLQLADRVTALRFDTVAYYPNHDPGVNVTVTDPAVARDICRATVTLPLMPEGTYNCPIDHSVAFLISCLDTEPASGACPIVFATIHPGGCQTATITDGTTTLARWTATPTGYWEMLAAALGVPLTTLFK